MFGPFRTRYVLAFGALLLSLLALSCKQYPYYSPQPGILEVRLKVKNTRTSILPWGAFNQFILQLKRLEATRAGFIEVSIFADLHAIRRNPDGDNYNCLDTLARDGEIILGEAYVPPQTYTGLRLETVESPFVIIITGGVGNPIEVLRPTPEPPALKELPNPGESFDISIREGAHTRVTVTFDLDSSLVKRTEVFELHPYYYVSSVENL